MARVPHPIKSHAALTYKEPLSVRMGRLFMLLGSIILVLGLLYTVAWLMTSMALKSGVKDWMKARKAQGYIASYEDKKVEMGGFPFSVRATLNVVKFAPPKNAQKKRDWFWSAKTVDFEIIPLPWTLGTVHVDLGAEQTLRLGRQVLEGRAESLKLSQDWLSDGIPESLGLSIKNWQLQSSGALLNVASLEMEGARKEDGAYGLDLQAERMDLPLGITGMGRRVSEVTLHAKLTENFGATGMGKEDLILWRDAGGTLELERIQVNYLPLILQGNGTVALDADLQPVGAFTARIQGFFETVSRLRRGGIIRGPDASMAKVVLGMLSKQPKNGGPASISLPLTLQERALFAGPVRLIEMPRIEW
ncbi:conserved hypothetical protein [Candidatus Terasakiella magnetica]|uniref:DUF2125 domain-containing protein n=1 Tax=Candidatus Terasakiella magnetica TaxID=1867952 RepID=A0A1C3RLT4_9PROT|nr:DUF2125 domain-containing protein [Candidatus Terasakiella magnetica]SCA58244.1 conserved hypothetical protein [Candidatus Terasakiella magnetica]